MNPKPSSFLCEKCRAPARPDETACAKCGGRVIKTCGDCGHPNSAAKKYCDQCGSKLTAAEPGKTGGARPEPAKPAPSPASPPSVGIPGLATPPPYPSMLQPPEVGIPGVDLSAPPPTPEPRAGERDIPKTGVMRLDRGSTKTPVPPREPMAPGVPMGSGFDPFRGPPPGMGQPRPAAGPALKAKVPVQPPPPRKPLLTPRQSKQALKLLAGVVLGAALAGSVLDWARNRRPDIVLPRVATRYLTALKTGDYETAHSMLTEASRKQCRIEEFKLIGTNAPWEFSDLRLVSADEGVAFLSYTLAAQGRPPEADYLMFVRESGVWARPFVWNLLNKVEDAFDRDSPEKALQLSQTAAQTNPYDPMAQAYLCEAVYYDHLVDRVEKECRAAFALTKKYPSKLTPASLYHLHAILGDTLKNSLKNYAGALDQYDILMGLPDISPADECDINLARAETHVALDDGPASLKDLAAAAAVCTKDSDLALIRHAQLVFAGASKGEALSLVQQYRMTEGGLSLLESRRSARDELARSMRHSPDERVELPEEAWVVDHLQGPRYKVTVRIGDSVLLTATADLWAKTVKVETQR